MEWLELIKELGPYFGILFFFIWRDHRREENQSAQIKDLNKFIQDELIDLVSKTNKSLDRVSEVLDRVLITQ